MLKKILNFLDLIYEIMRKYVNRVTGVCCLFFGDEILIFYGIFKDIKNFFVIIFFFMEEGKELEKVIIKKLENLGIFIVLWSRCGFR